MADIRLPSGKILRNVPKGVTREQIMERYPEEFPTPAQQLTDRPVGGGRLGLTQPTNDRTALENLSLAASVAPIGGAGILAGKAIKGGAGLLGKTATGRFAKHGKDYLVGSGKRALGKKIPGRGGSAMELTGTLQQGKGIWGALREARAMTGLGPRIDKLGNAAKQFADDALKKFTKGMGRKPDLDDVERIIVEAEKINRAGSRAALASGVTTAAGVGTAGADALGFNQGGYVEEEKPFTGRGILGNLQSSGDKLGSAVEAASFLPVVGPAIDTARGDYAMAAMGIIPGGKIAAKAGKAVKAAKRGPKGKTMEAELPDGSVQPVSAKEYAEAWDITPKQARRRFKKAEDNKDNFVEGGSNKQQPLRDAANKRKENTKEIRGILSSGRTDPAIIRKSVKHEYYDSQQIPHGTPEKMLSKVDRDTIDHMVEMETKYRKDIAARGGKTPKLTMNQPGILKREASPGPKPDQSLIGKSTRSYADKLKQAKEDYPELSHLPDDEIARILDIYQ